MEQRRNGKENDFAKECERFLFHLCKMIDIHYCDGIPDLVCMNVFSEFCAKLALQADQDKYDFVNYMNDVFEKVRKDLEKNESS